MMAGMMKLALRRLRGIDYAVHQNHGVLQPIRRLGDEVKLWDEECKDEGLNGRSGQAGVETE
jgi:hypothetical protein